MAEDQPNESIERDRLIWQEAIEDQELYDLLFERRELRDQRLEQLGKPGYQVQSEIDNADKRLAEIQEEIRKRLILLCYPEDTIR